MRARCSVGSGLRVATQDDHPLHHAHVLQRDICSEAAIGSNYTSVPPLARSSVDEDLIDVAMEQTEAASEGLMMGGGRWVGLRDA
eukprot:CAMPEP_0177569108 /NCGR_PEP_ID=MMETSP0369-20130122/76120_1 /TAXON_ID=447022 ORGANISM="Scrippsiella hangoei-like, Strain SHHI-4" /NCGR_SAMPLE_ID=MMETSP0369 /ASSEMBLY_ACC=CAM_ASM_000364 /LENGTH=84 /DNA_ID=CAMNT_0019056735 /DNA_START=188 /DNA_END=441 /DNA_ORIENTATION=+